MEIENDIPVPTDAWGDTIPQEEKQPVETPKKRQRGRGRQKKVTPASDLLEAIKFIKPCQRKTGTVVQRHCCIQGGWIGASDGIVMIATKIEEGLAACPQTLQLEEALKQVGSELSITQLSEHSLAVVSGDFKAVIPCVTADQIQMTPPDPEIAVIDDRIKLALMICNPLVTEGAERAEYASALLQSGTAVATNGHAIVEYHHGIDLPPNVLIPKAAIKAILNGKKSLRGFGYSGQSATFWFEDDSFVKTQLYGEQYPNYKTLFKQPITEAKLIEIPNEFFKAVKTIDKFTKSGIVYFENGKLASNELETEASTYELAELPNGHRFNSKNLLLVKDAFDKVQFFVQENGMSQAFFFGKNCRGLVLGIEASPDEIPF